MSSTCVVLLQHFCVARTMLLCCVGILLNGCFLHLLFDCKIQNWGRTILHLAGQVWSQLVDYVQSHWHKSTNLSVCSLQPQLLRQLEVRFTRAAGTRLRGLEMSRSLNLLSVESPWLTRKRCKSPVGMQSIRMTSSHKYRYHPIAARKRIWFFFATSARAGRTFRSRNMHPKIIPLRHPILWQHSPMSGKRVSIKRVDFSIRKLPSVWPNIACHYLSGHCRHALALSAKMRFASNSL